MSESEKWDLKDEDRELVQQLAQEYIEPALQLALKSAAGKGTPLEILSAMANAYGSLLVDLLGHKAAASFLRGHADHIAAREVEPLSEEKH